MAWIAMAGMLVVAVGIAMAFLHVAPGADEDERQVRLVSVVCGVVSAVGLAVVLVALTLSPAMAGEVVGLASAAAGVAVLLLRLFDRRRVEVPSVRGMSCRSFLVGFAVAGVVVGLVLVACAFAVGTGLGEAFDG